MTVFKYFLKNAARRKSIFIIYFIILMAIGLINTSGAVKKQPERGFIEYRPVIALMKEDVSGLADALEEFLMKEGSVKESPKTIREAEEMIFLERADAVIRIPERAETELIKGNTCLEILYDYNNIKGHIIENQIYKYLLLLKASEKEGRFDYDLVDRSLQKEVDVVFRTSEAETDSYKQKWLDFYFKFSAYMITAVVIGMIGLAMSDFQKSEVLQRIRSSSIKTLRMQGMIYLGQLCITFIITVLVILSGVVLLKGKVAGLDLPKKVINLSVFSLSVLSMTFMINTITGNKHIKSALSTVVSLGMAFLSGVMIPQEFLSDFTLQLSKWMPMFYYVRINDNPNIGLRELSLDLGIQLGFAVLFLAIGVTIAHLKRRKIV